MKWLTVTSIPTAATLFGSVVPAFYRAPLLTDLALLRAWKHALTAQYMVRRNIEPRAVRWSQRHMLHQCADVERFKTIEDEVIKRGLTDRYGVEITVLTGK
jgi:hypothetical protein